MFVFDLLKGDGRRLQPIAVIVGAGMLILLAGLWFVQIVSAEHFESNLIKQSFRTVRIPAIRGRILDCNGNVLAEDQPRYNAILYLEDLQDQFDAQYRTLARLYTNEHHEAITSKGRMNILAAARRQLQLEADCDVVSNITYRVSTRLDEPRMLNTNGFIRHYDDYPYVPFQIVPNLTPNQVAIFAEQLSTQPALELETQPVRIYPNGEAAAHILGYVQRRDATEGGDISFTMPDYEGRSGTERVYDDELRGQAGLKSVLVNNLNYRQRENIETPNEPGDDVYLTIDLGLQRAAEKALANAKYEEDGVPVARGAAVVMDPRNGDILAIASTPTFDPNEFVPGHRPMSPGEMERLADTRMTPELNRAVTGAYPPGSTFKIITSIACLENGLDPNEVFDSPGEYRVSATHSIGDTAGAGKFNFNRAFYRSSNTYFIHYGMIAGLRKILEVARRFHLGEKTDIATGQESTAGFVPTPDKAGKTLPWSSTPDVCIGQEITATPLQMACMISVIANGGTLYWPRDVSYLRSQDSGAFETLVQPGRVRDHVYINPQHLEIIRRAMLDDTEHVADGVTKAEGPGSAYAAFHHGGVPDLEDFHIAGKTGTAEVKSPGSNYKRITWFDSYAPYDNPRYVVVVMVEDGFFGGTTCAPVAEKIYEAILKRERTPKSKPSMLAHN
ncbi:MAG TPA: penicillin-binding transpeptidase domain-containing protein [Verrucomicrobiae bacterium]